MKYTAKAPKGRGIHEAIKFVRLEADDLEDEVFLCRLYSILMSQPSKIRLRSFIDEEYWRGKR